MGNKRPDGNIEITSQQLLDELREIKDRVGALENVSGIAHQAILATYFAEVLSNPQRIALMNAMREPRSKKELQLQCGHKHEQGLNYHLNPLREGLVQSVHEEGVEKFEWSLLFKRLQKRKRDELLKVTGTTNGKRKAKKDPA